jgi:hypothetical protein
MFTSVTTDSGLVIDTPENFQNDIVLQSATVIADVISTSKHSKIIIKTYRAKAINLILLIAVGNRTITDVEFVAPNLTPEDIKILAGSAIDTIKIDYICTDDVIEALRSEMH